MTNSTPSIAERARVFAAGATVVGAHFLGHTAVFVLGEEALLFAAADGASKRVAVHAGAVLASAADGERIVTAGDDGTVVATAADGTVSPIATDAKKRWIDHVAIGPDGALAWSAGKEAFVRTRKGEQRRLEVPSTVGGLAFARKGLRVAVAHYHGVTLWFPNATQVTPERLEWKGAHHGVTFSPDGRFLVTAMQEPALHGWRLSDGNNMSMSGYDAKVRSLSWSADGEELATSGANELILWPFHGKDGPMGKAPRLLAPGRQLVSKVACHPGGEVVAVGYEDGLVLVVRMVDGAEIVAHRPGGAPITALAWRRAGTAMAFATEDGEAGVINIG